MKEEPEEEKENGVSTGLFKMDVLFYNSCMKAKKAYVLRNLYILIKLLLLAIFLPIDITLLSTPNQIIIIWISVSIGTCLFSLVATVMTILSGYRNSQDNNIFFLRLSEVHGHSIPSQPIQNQNKLKSIEECVCMKMYNQQNLIEIDSQGLTPQLKMSYQTAYAQTIQSAIMEEKGCLALIQAFSKFLGLTSIIFGIFALAKSSSLLLPAEIGVGVTYLLLQAFSIRLILLYLVGIGLVIALSPVGIIIFCFYFCCCRKLEDTEPIVLPKTVPATAAMIQEADGSCSICLQKFQVKKNVIVLPCSNKHMFHEACITNWLNFGSTCPTCRHPLGS